MLKIIISPYLSRNLSEFHGHKFATGDGNNNKNQKFANSKWRMDAALKITFRL